MRNQHYFCLDESKSPTYANLSKYLLAKGWGKAHCNWRSDFNQNNFKFNPSASETLEFKHSLAKLVAKYCPEVMPLTYCINDHNWPDVLSQITLEKQKIENRCNSLKNKGKSNNMVWILKPALLNNGKNIKIFEQLSDVEQHYLSTNRLGGEHVLQQYITNPHLLKGPATGHKYSIRMFVVITNYAGAFIYPDGYFNIALNPYSPDNFADLKSHLTNEHLSDEEPNVIQIHSNQIIFFKSLYPNLKSIIASTINGLRQYQPAAFVGKKQRTLAIFGFDFTVDSNMRVWLLEANHGPCFPSDDQHILQKSLYFDFWQNLISRFVFPIAAKQPLENIDYKRFEAVSTADLR